MSCERETDVGRVGCPDDAKSAGYDAGKGKAECHAGHEEFLAATEVYLEERHVDDGGEEEEEHEDCGDGCVDWVSGYEAYDGGFWRVGWGHICSIRGHLASQLKTKDEKS